MAVTDLEILPVVVTARPGVDSLGLPYQQLPEGTDPGALRIVRARHVQPGDWYLGACEQPTPGSAGRTWGVHTYAAYAATPRLNEAADALAMDGESFIWNPDALVMITPRQWIPAPYRAPTGGAHQLTNELQPV